jgi:hypothetical protein
VEQPNGRFSAGGTLGQCSVQVQQGNVTATDQIKFQVIQQDVNCFLITGEFSGKTTSDGTNLSGQWMVENVDPPEGGSWALS